MTALFDQLFAAAASPTLDHLFGELVTIVRGTQTTSGVTASWPKTEQPITVEKPALPVSFWDRAWVVSKTAYVLNDVAVEPKEGDRLIDGAGSHWEVLSQGRQRGFQDRGSEWQLFTKRVK